MGIILPPEIILRRKISRRINRRGAEENDGYCFHSAAGCCYVRVHIFVHVPRAIFTSPRRARDYVRPVIFSFLRHRNFFSGRIYLPAATAAAAAASPVLPFSLGANFAAVCIRHYEVRGGSRTPAQTQKVSRATACNIIINARVVRSSDRAA